MERGMQMKQDWPIVGLSSNILEMCMNNSHASHSSPPKDPLRGEEMLTARNTGSIV